jgi:hypothetical protein
MAIVLAGARGDREEHGAGIAHLKAVERTTEDPELLARLVEARARLEELAAGRPVEDLVVIEDEGEDGVEDSAVLFDAEEGEW